MSPTVTTSSVTSLTRTTGVLTGYGNPGGDATTGWFRYSTASPGTCNDSFGTRAPAMGGSALGAGTSNASFSQAITGLAPATTYFYCAIWPPTRWERRWERSSRSSHPRRPRLSPRPPPASPPARRRSTAVATPTAASTTGWFRYSTTNPGTCDDKFGSRAPVSGGTYLGSDIYDQPFSQSISGLSGGTTYYYCAIVTSTEGTAFGVVSAFTTSGNLDRDHQRRHEHFVHCRDSQRCWGPQRRQCHRLVPLQHHQPRHVQRQLWHPLPAAPAFPSALEPRV
jgi:hypothetical protein